MTLTREGQGIMGNIYSSPKHNRCFSLRWQNTCLARLIQDHLFTMSKEQIGQQGEKMGTKTGIQWCDHTFNPWRGCTKVSPGCQHCYARTMSQRNPTVLGTWGPNGTRIIAAESYWRQAYRWNKAAKKAGERRRVFCGSLMDWLEDRPDLDEPRARLVKTIAETPHLDWLLLTKRPENWHNLLQRAYECTVRAGDTDVSPWIGAWLHGSYPPHVWVATSVENQQRADERIPLLLDIPARVRFLSCEPLLGTVDLGLLGTVPKGISPRYRPVHEMLHWVIVGGESGPEARPMHPDWARDLRDQCQEAGVAFFFKQWGEWAKAQPGVIPEAAQAYRWPDGTLMYRVGKKRAGRELDGQEWNEFPERGY